MNLNLDGLLGPLSPLLNESQRKGALSQGLLGLGMSLLDPGMDQYGRRPGLGASIARGMGNFNQSVNAYAGQALNAEEIRKKIEREQMFRLLVQASGGDISKIIEGMVGLGGEYTNTGLDAAVKLATSKSAKPNLISKVEEFKQPDGQVISQEVFYYADGPQAGQVAKRENIGFAPPISLSVGDKAKTQFIAQRATKLDEESDAARSSLLSAQGFNQNVFRFAEQYPDLSTGDALTSAKSFLQQYIPNADFEGINDYQALRAYSQGIASKRAKADNGSRVTDYDVQNAKVTVGDPENNRFGALVSIGLQNQILDGREYMYKAMRRDWLLEKESLKGFEAEWKKYKEQGTEDDVGSLAWGQKIVNDTQERVTQVRATRGASSAAVLPANAAARLKEGVVTTFGNGQKWTLQNGTPVQVK